MLPPIAASRALFSQLRPAAQMKLTCLNNMASAYVTVTLHSGFFDQHRLVDDSISCRVMLKVKATPQTTKKKRCDD